MGGVCSTNAIPKTCRGTCGKRCGEACDRCSDRGVKEEYYNSFALGRGGDLVVQRGCVVCLVVAFDYQGYRIDERAGCTPLNSGPDARRFAGLASDSGAEVLEFYDRGGLPRVLGFPQKDVVLGHMKRLGTCLGSNDVFVLYFSGCGKQVRQKVVAAKQNGHDKTSGVDEPRIEDQLCFVRPDGTPDFLTQDELSSILSTDFKPKTRVFLISDCYRAGNMMCDLTQGCLRERSICQMSAARENHIAEHSGDSFTGALLETVEELIHDDEREFSAVEAFNACYLKFSDKEHPPNFKFAHTIGFDPDTLAWPLVPPEDWTAPSIGPQSPTRYFDSIISPPSPGKIQVDMQEPPLPRAAASMMNEGTSEASSPKTSRPQRMRKQVTFNDQNPSSQDLFNQARGNSPPPLNTSGIDTSIIGYVPSVVRTPSAAQSSMPSRAVLQSMPTACLHSGSPGSMARSDTDNLRAQGIFKATASQELAQPPTQWLQPGTQTMRAQGSDGNQPLGTQWLLNPGPAAQLPVIGMYSANDQF